MCCWYLSKRDRKKIFCDICYKFKLLFYLGNKTFLLARRNFEQ